jgi:Cu2+-exporting ATPase
MTASSCATELATPLAQQQPVDNAAKHQAVFAVDGIHCAGCINAIERTLLAIPDVTAARVNYTLRRVGVDWRGDNTTRETVIDALKVAGYRATFFEARSADATAEREMRRLMLCLAVAGFAAMNIMLLSAAVWAGNASDISPETRDLFHWLSALIALPAAAYAGRPFYESAFRALAARRLNMDVPITIGVLMALAVSVYQTAVSAEHAYFESAIMLLFFLLGGRVLDQAMRRRTRALAGNLTAFKTSTIERIDGSGQPRTVDPAMLVTGDHIRLKSGDRLPVDACVLEGSSTADQSMITGETMPQPVAAGDMIYAGALNMGGTLTLEVRAAVGETLIDEVQELLEKATETRSRRLDLVDKAAQFYAPVVHVTAALAALGWLMAGAGLHQAILVATTVLIITCPCALALAVPAVQVAAAGAMFRKGLFLNIGTAVERLAEADLAVFDKTGTLTLPELSIANFSSLPAGLSANAARLALSSHHPLAKALAGHAADKTEYPEVEEIPGQGLRTSVDGREMLLGSTSFCRITDSDAEVGQSRLGFRHGDETIAFNIEQPLRADARTTIDRLRAAGFDIMIMSGDRTEVTEMIAGKLGIKDFFGDLRPTDKITRIEALSAAGHKVLMVGDGLNDAPALAAAHVSISPASAMDLTQAHADAVFLGEKLVPVADAVDIARRARRLMTQNLSFATAYNALAIPLAVFGFVTPLLAAVAMSASSLTVTINALRALPRSRKPASSSASMPIGQEART